MRRVDLGAAGAALNAAKGAIETAFVGVHEAHDFGLRMLLERIQAGSETVMEFS